MGSQNNVKRDPDTQFQFSILHCEIIFVASFYKWYL